jgi:RNase P subunit RPR2
MHAYHIKGLLSTGVKQKVGPATDHTIRYLRKRILAWPVFITTYSFQICYSKQHNKYNHKEIPVSLVGKYIDAYCTKCKLLLAHVVMYEVDGKVKKVKCKTCGSEHIYRTGAQQKKSSDFAVRPGKEKRVNTAPKSRKATYDAPIQWELKYSEMNPESPVKVYRVQDIYTSEEVIRHPLFGLGFIGRVSDTSMEVLFKDAVRRMAMNIK